MRVYDDDDDAIVLLWKFWREFNLFYVEYYENITARELREELQ